MLRVFTYVFALTGMIGARYSDRRRLTSHLIWSTFLMLLTFAYYVFNLYSNFVATNLLEIAVATLIQAIGIRKIRRYIESIYAFERELANDVERQTIELTPTAQPTSVPTEQQPQIVYVPVPQFYPAFNNNGEQTPNVFPFAYPFNSFPMAPVPAQGQMIPNYSTQYESAKQ